MYTRAHIIVDRKSRALLQPLSFLNSWSSWLCALRGCIYIAATLLWPTQVIMHCYMDVFVQLQPYYGHTGLYSPDFGFCGTRATMSLCFNLFCNSNDCGIVSVTKKKRTWWQKQSQILCMRSSHYRNFHRTHFQQKARDPQRASSQTQRQYTQQFHTRLKSSNSKPTKAPPSPITTKQGNSPEV